MTHAPEPRKKLITSRLPKLHYAGFIYNDAPADGASKDALTLKLVFKASPQAMAELDSVVGDVTDRHFSEKDTKEDTYTCFVPLESRGDAGALAEAIFNRMPYRLSNVRTQADSEQFAGSGESSIFTPQVMLHAQDDKYDPDNFVGELSMDVIKRKAQSAIEGGLAVDPMFNEPGSMRLMDLFKTPNTQAEALLMAEKDAKELDKNFGLSRFEYDRLQLTGMRGEALKGGSKPLRSDYDCPMNAVIATLQGESEEAIDNALKHLHRRYANQIAPASRDTEKHSVELVMGAAADQYIDPTSMLAALHVATSCELPITIKPGALHRDGFEKPYQPSLGVYLDNGVTDAQGLLREASARYSGSLLPGKNDVITLPDSDDVKVVMPEAYEQQDTALRHALQAHQKVSQTLNAPEVSAKGK